MSDSKHTPGPWAYRMSGEDCCDFEVYAGEGAGSIDTVAGEYGIESEADARLIAASPDLLEAAVKALNFIANTETELGITLDSGDALRAAIAKAGG